MHGVPKKFAKCAVVYDRFCRRDVLPAAKPGQVVLVVCDKRGGVWGEMNIHLTDGLGSGRALDVAEVAGVARLALSGAAGPGGDRNSVERLLTTLAMDPERGAKIAECFDGMGAARAVALVRGDDVWIDVSAEAAA